jgi:predicted HNH restriction endonuclease
MPYKNKDKQRKYQRDWINDRMDIYVTRTRERRRRYKLKALELLGGKCKKCGYNKCIKALTFHHLGGKDASVSRLSCRSGWKTIEEEIKKCIILCLNCHMELHADEYEND